MNRDRRMHPVRMLRPDRRIAVLAALVVAPVLVVACSLPPDDAPTRLDADDLGPELANPTTSTTTTVPPTTVPPTTDSTGSGPTTTSTTTTLPVSTEQQRIYYSIGSSEVLQAITLQLPERTSYSGIRNELEVPRPEVRGFGLASAVRPGLIDEFTFDDESVTLTIALDAEVFGNLSESQRRRAIGQIVLTYTSFAPPDSGSVGFVRFTIDDDPISVFVPDAGGSSDEGEPLTFADFQSLRDEGDPPDTEPPTSPPTTAPQSTVPVDPPTTAA